MENLKPKTLNLKPVSRRGITIVEMVIALAILAAVGAIVIKVMNPAGLFASSRNRERGLHLQAILSAIRQNIAENSFGTFSCASGAIPTSSKRMANAAGSGNYDIAPCLIPAYLDAMPFDPVASSAKYFSNSDYNSGYNVFRNATTGQVTVLAPYAELGASVSSTR